MQMKPEMNGEAQIKYLLRAFAEIYITRWVALMIQLGKFVGGGGGVADTNYLYPARWGWIN